VKNIESLYLASDKAIEEDDYDKAIELLKTILEEDPKFARAHNSLGWLFKYKYTDSEKAEMHYKLAIQFNPKYGSPYLNYIYLLRDQQRLDEMFKMLNTANEVSQVSKVGLYDEYGTYYELIGDYKKAIEYYNKAIAKCLNSDIDEFKAHIKRCIEKQNYFSSNRFTKAFRILFGFD